MPKRKSFGGGTTLNAPLFLRSRNSGQSSDIVDEVFRANHRARLDYFEDFVANALTPPAVVIPGTPSSFANPNFAGGAWAWMTSAVAGAETAGFHWGDNLLIDSRKAFFFEAKANIGSAAVGNRFIYGLGSAYNANVDAIARSAWFRIEVNRRVYCEVDDGTNDWDDQDGGVNIPSTFPSLSTFAIDGRDLGAIRFYVNDNLVKTLSAPLMAGGLQPIMLVQRDSGPTQFGFTADYYRVSWDRE